MLRHSLSQCPDTFLLCSICLSSPRLCISQCATAQPSILSYRIIPFFRFLPVFLRCNLHSSLFIDIGYIYVYVYTYTYNVYGHTGCWARLFGRTLLSSSPRRKVVISWQRLDSTLSLNWMKTSHSWRSAYSWINSRNDFICTRRPQLLSRSRLFSSFRLDFRCCDRSSLEKNDQFAWVREESDLESRRQILCH